MGQTIMKGGYYDIRTRRTWTVACLLMLVGLLIVTARGVVQAQEPGATTSTVFVFDTSGSMEGDKLVGAKRAGSNVINIIRTENVANPDAGNRAALIEFNNTATVRQPLTADLDAVQTALQRLNANGGTGMASGLQQAIESLDNAVAHGQPIIILLSDGLPNFTLAGNQNDAQAYREVLDLASEAGEKQYCIYTVGFGTGMEVDEDLLREVAQRSGCGDYFRAADADELAQVYVRLRHISAGGEIRFEQTGTIAQGEEQDLGVFEIPPNQSQLLFTLQWPGSRIDSRLTDPRNNIVDQSYPGATITRENNIEVLLISNPRPGQWRAGAIGIDIPGGSTTFSAIASSRLGDIVLAANNTGVWLLLVGLVGFGAFAWVQTQDHARWSVEVAEPGRASYRVPVLRRGIRIGRSPDCDIRLGDTNVSRDHCRIEPTTDPNRLNLYDENSKMGTRRNGERVTRASLRSRDVVEVSDAPACA